jgi:hypothetical protein
MELPLNRRQISLPQLVVSGQDSFDSLLGVAELTNESFQPLRRLNQVPFHAREPLFASLPLSAHRGHLLIHFNHPQISQFRPRLDDSSGPSVVRHTKSNQPFSSFNSRQSKAEHPFRLSCVLLPIFEYVFVLPSSAAASHGKHEPGPYR